MLDYWQTIHKMEIGENPPIFASRFTLISLLERSATKFKLSVIALQLIWLLLKY